MNQAIIYSASLALSLALFSGQDIAFAEAPPAAEACVVCHNDDGISDDPHVPTIAGASAYFLENQLAIFNAEARPCATDYFSGKEQVSAENHCAALAELSEDDFVTLAEYFSEQPFRPADQEVDAELASQGESIHAKSCDRCHSDAGGLALDDAGILAGQWKPYLIKQFELLKAGERWQPDKMAPEIRKLSDQDMKALANFYAREGKN
ncbi:MAG: cytochrome c [Wenzhouxiangellaceae bacterium]